MPVLPSLSNLSSVSQEQQVQVLDTLFEPSPELHTLMDPVLGSESFSSYTGLIDAVGSQLAVLLGSRSSTDKQVLVKILGSHPRLGRPPPTTTAGGGGGGGEPLSELSKKEQGSLSTIATDRQMEQLSLLNHEYEEKFPGLRFVYVILRWFICPSEHGTLTGNSFRTFVNGRDRDTIMQEMRARIARGDQQREMEENIQVRYLGCPISCALFRLVRC